MNLSILFTLQQTQCILKQISILGSQIGTIVHILLENILLNILPAIKSTFNYTPVTLYTVINLFYLYIYVCIQIYMYIILVLRSTGSQTQVHSAFRIIMHIFLLLKSSSSEYKELTDRDSAIQGNNDIVNCNCRTWIHAY